MTPLLLAATSEGPSLITFFGRFHPAAVHFPIAMLGVAALMEFLQIIRRKPAFHAATFTLVAVATVSAVLATLMGLANAAGKRSDDTLEAHRWAGIATTVVTMIMMLLVNKARAVEGKKVQIARGGIFLGMILVSITGHYGGILVYGDSYYSSAWPWASHDKDPLLIAGSGKMDFKADIAPILQASCFKCHGGDKGIKGKFDLTSRASTMKGGATGPAIVPLKPQKSSFYTLLVTKDEEDRMPKKGNPLPPDQIEKIRRWIEQGAEWPDGFEFKK